MDRKYANIIVDITHEKLDRPFQYKIPDELKVKVHPGIQVLIPFGRSDKMIKGYVLEVTDICQYSEERLKYIDSILEEGRPIEAQLIELAAWIKDNYGSTMNQALKTVIPVKNKIKPKNRKNITIALDENELTQLIEKYNESVKYKGRYEVLKYLYEKKEATSEEIEKRTGVSQTIINSMAKSGILNLNSESYLRNPVKNKKEETDKLIHTDEQIKIINDISVVMDSNEKKPQLIFGITGSGKTEIYIDLIRKTIKSGKQAIVLIPEIALVYQTLKRFFNVFENRVSVINSKMSQGEKHDQFERAGRGEIDIVIGPRSALFTPFSNLGLIIIDEEQESSYKSESVPKYHARETAIKRAEISGATVVMGSATPSVDSYYRAMNGEYGIHYLKNRANESFLPKVHLIDLREELKTGNKSVFSRKLDELIRDRLYRKEQIMLFINRRGYSGFMSCRSCGFAMKCPHCDVGLTVHNNGELVCHYCGYSIPVVKQCPSCGSKHIAAFGTGTQKIEVMVKETYPEARVLRMDMDTTTGKDGYEKILSEFSEGKADILIGTQMIVKGHDYPNVTLVGIIAADLSLYANDFRASERTFQLLTQAAGRAGRGNNPGEVVIQTYSMDSYCVLAAAQQDYQSFYEREIMYRKLMCYPPVYNMAVILITSKDTKKLTDAVKKISDIIDINNKGEIMKIGPADAVLSKINDVYRKVIYLKCTNSDQLIDLKDAIEIDIKENFEIFNNTGVQFDFSPMGNY